MSLTPELIKVRDEIQKNAQDYGLAWWAGELPAPIAGDFDGDGWVDLFVAGAGGDGDVADPVRTVVVRTCDEVA